MFSQRRSHYWSQQSRTYSTDLLHRCVTPQLSLLLFRFVAFHYDMKFIAAFLFFQEFSAKQQKKQRKKKSLQRYRTLSDNYMENIIKCSHPNMTGQNDRQDESLTGQAHDQGGQCSLAGRYFEPCIMQLIVDFTCFFVIFSSYCCPKV